MKPAELQAVNITSMQVLGFESLPDGLKVKIRPCDLEQKPVNHQPRHEPMLRPENGLSEHDSSLKHRMELRSDHVTKLFPGAGALLTRAHAPA